MKIAICPRIDQETVDTIGELAGHAQAGPTHPTAPTLLMAPTLSSVHTARLCKTFHVLAKTPISMFHHWMARLLSLRHDYFLLHRTEWSGRQ